MRQGLLRDGGICRISKRLWDSARNSSKLIRKLWDTIWENDFRANSTRAGQEWVMQRADIFGFLPSDPRSFAGIWKYLKD